MKNITLVALTLVLAVSCSKDRNVIILLDGTWNVDSVQLKYVHNIDKPFGTKGQTYVDLDTTQQYTLFNCGTISFDKMHTANGDYRLGNLDFKIPKLPGTKDTAYTINRPLNEKEPFSFYVDQVVNKKHYSKIGMVGDTSKTYRSGEFSDSDLVQKHISFSYTIDSLKYTYLPWLGTYKVRKGMFKVYISKQ
ncbi:MAG: hypothetical protein ABL940_04350 [Bacteroidia bacterium]